MSFRKVKGGIRLGRLAICEATFEKDFPGFEQRLVIDSPVMPARLDWIKIEDLKVGAGKISFIVHRTPAGAAIEMIEEQGEVSVEIRK